ncbi:AAA family ATPase [Duganella sp. HH105]|uniref:AAA family ATPase n=1 Tax=Duganella sp. HH105 TaxID=1781067 RepID=UPI000893923A|nr:AAA family ATPase [Duganella sp. HH105]OEZ57035.1 hypothetical protein DUGA6_47040 [Duganella sp. HH105]
MKIHIISASFYNRAPFEKLEIFFEENEIAILTAVNGRGKTTILSHIVDAFHEMARPHFAGGYEGKENKFYRISSSIENLNPEKPSLAYLRFKLSNGEIVDYLGIRGTLSEDEYNAFNLPADKINFSEIKDSIETDGYVKKISSSFDKKKTHSIFSQGVLTYFPSYRYEFPSYLNDPYKIEISYRKTFNYAGKLVNPIEVVSGLPQLANWIMDVVLDIRVANDQTSQKIFNNLNSILTHTVTSKGHGPIRFGIGPRSFGSTRIQVLTNETDSKQIYPSIFGISSGESSILCIFGEIIRQADNLLNGISMNEISGIVLIDEVDKHLHIKLQKEVLPILFKLFPNVQFIVSSHSPFLSIGLAEITPDRCKIIDLENFGISKDPTTNDLYSEVYKMMIDENYRFKDLYHALKEKVSTGISPLVITEGKTDVQHLKTAKNRLGIQDCDIEFFDISGDWGDSKLEILLDQLSKLPQARRIIGIFDRDVQSIVSKIEMGGRDFKDYGNNVFAFCLPVPAGRHGYTNISIEFFYKDEDITKEKDGKRLYFDNEVEFRQSAATKSKRNLVKLSTPDTSGEHTKKIFDENIGSLDWIHSKAAFSTLVENDAEFSRNFDFSSFQSIFQILKQIIDA